MRYINTICLDYILRTPTDLIKENDFIQRKKARGKYPTGTMTDAVYANDLALLSNIPEQAESLRSGLENAAGGIVFFNANKILCFK